MNFNFDPESNRYQFVKHRYKYFLLSGLLIGLGLLIIAIMGINLGVDFESGSTLEIMIQDQAFTSEEVEAVLADLGLEPGSIRLIGNNNEIAEVRFIGTLDQEQITQVRQAFAEHFGQVDINESTVSPMVARELARQAVYGILLASVAVIIYVAIRFEYRFGVAAIIALFHDALFIVALFALLRLEVDLTFIAAVLTIVGYSINDTIVIFDRLRENMKFAKLKTVEDLEQLVNRSIVENLPRTLNTSITVVFAALALYLLGGEGIRNFSLALLVGLLAGTYSSIFIAAQLWFEWKKRELKKKLFHPQNA
ncbi:preprotein translocase SecF subunit [Caldalkalibacillus uzonensis]|uniref:Protein-export membrane protein SecF n=1 Tax=Caldalkalibacillus uzonensis TaxID=353224 RepID=A0ABU0CWV8_9BACI|nr:protein translocase subunit SecF [Caldalkalibacillus uzonensis]MDQ0339527.1 preprotein translocase SecF subunit [Caldalkalibacillus uzonensis]